jgi:tight adherence protein B
VVLRVAAPALLGILLLLLTQGNLLAMLLGVVLGVVGPMVYLSMRTARRKRAFMSVLPDTLALMASGLRAGYSLPQAMDSVVREGREPIRTEFNRALVEARLGVPAEDALEAMAERMSSQDFKWVVMAIRIQREVGGNLAELLDTVSGPSASGTGSAVSCPRCRPRGGCRPGSSGSCRWPSPATCCSRSPRTCSPS